VELHPSTHRGLCRRVERVVEPGDEHRDSILQASVRVDVVCVDARDELARGSGRSLPRIGGRFGGVVDRPRMQSRISVEG